MTSDPAPHASTTQKTRSIPRGFGSLIAAASLALAARWLGMVALLVSIFQAAILMGSTSSLNNPEILLALVLGGVSAALFGTWLYIFFCKAAFPVLHAESIILLDSDLKRLNPFLTIARDAIRRVELAKGPTETLGGVSDRHEWDFHLEIETITDEKHVRDYFGGTEGTRRQLIALSEALRSWR